MATPRKSAAQKAATPRRAARPETPAAPVAAERISILDDLSHDGGAPVPISLLGVECDVKRQFTGDEVATVYRLMRTTDIAAGLAILTTDGPALWEKISELDPDHAARALNKIVGLTGIYEGEPFAPLRSPSSQSPAAGAQPSPESNATTD